MENEFNKKVGSKLYEARTEKGLEQEFVAKKIGKTQSYISKLENGVKKITAYELNELAKLYCKPYEYFIDS